MALYSFQSSFIVISLFDPHDNPWGRQSRYLYPHFTDEKPRVQRDGDLSQSDITSKLEETGPVSSLWWLYQGFPHQTALHFPVGAWGTSDWEAGVTKVFEVNPVQCRGCACSLRLSVLSSGDHVRNRTRGRLSWLRWNKIRSDKAEHWQISSPAPMLHKFPQLWLLLPPPLDSAQAWPWEQEHQMLWLRNCWSN